MINQPVIIKAVQRYKILHVDIIIYIYATHIYLVVCLYIQRDVHNTAVYHTKMPRVFELA